MVVEKLAESGDSLRKARPVFHWCYFRNESDRSRFVERIMGEGFRVENYPEHLQDDERPFGVQISRMDLIDCQNLFEYTLFLWDLAYEHGGDYDGWETSVERE